MEQFQKNDPQRKIVKTLKIPPSTVYTIIKRFRESGPISVCKGQGRRSKLDAHDLLTLRQHCIKNNHDSLLDITAWAQEHFQKSLSVNTVRCAIQKCQIKLYHAKKKPYLNTMQSHCLGQSSFKTVRGKMENCSVVR
ncbi:hypothetical protein [Paraclostridium dentum]|uniref:hypothetical protein n=1 Tax=Paraclostridium dentum TaxID=2662455 RepID=UPI003F32F2D7